VETLEIAANGFRFSARAAGPGDGRGVLLLHGFPQTSYSWRRQISALAEQGYRAVAPDQRGYANGARPEDPDAYAPPHLVADALAMASALGMERFDLVGHDFGGMLAWLLGSRHPERVRSLTVVSTPHPAAFRTTRRGGDADQVAKSGYMDFFQRPDEPERFFLGDDGSGSGLRTLYETAGMEAGAVDEYLATFCQPGAMTAALNWYRAQRGEHFADLASVVVPTLYVWSSADAALGRVAAERTAGYVSGPFQFEVLDGVSHWVPEEAPEQLNALLLAHLART
jgi:pimeloyl-ACP methyl ester carboxylesterase